MSHLNPAAERAVATGEQGSLSQAIVRALLGEAPAEADEIAQAVPRWPGWMRIATLVAGAALVWAIIVAAVLHALAQ